MDISKFLLQHTGGKKSLTTTCFIVGFVIVNAKLLFSSTFTGIDYGAAIAALGGVYILRRGKESKDDSTKS